MGHGLVVSSATVASIVFCLSGCGKKADDRPGLSQVAPGTPLAEADFEQTLRATGAEYVVVQVYLEACGPCMTEALQLTKMQEPWREDGVAILGMGMDETPAGAEAFFNNTGGRIKFPLYFAPWFAMQQQVDATPTLFIYSASGEQVYRVDPMTAKTSIMAAVGEKLTELLAVQ